jgi:dihydrofolate reductase
LLAIAAIPVSAHICKNTIMKISIYIASSANGYISNGRNVPDWLSNEYGEGFYSISQKSKAVIMGKTTYEILAPDYLPLKDVGTTVVLTTDRQAQSENPTVIFSHDDPTTIAQMLADKGHSEAVIVGGAMAISSFVRAGLVNDIYFVIEPSLFGTGLPLLVGYEDEIKLKLIECKKLNDNTVQLHYEFQKSQA